MFEGKFPTRIESSFQKMYFKVSVYIFVFQSFSKKSAPIIKKIFVTNNVTVVEGGRA